MKAVNEILFQILRIGLGRTTPQEVEPFPSNVDWKELTDIALVNGVGGLAYDGAQQLVDAGVCNVPKTCLIKLFNQTLTIEKSCRRQREISSKLAEIWEKEGIRTIVLKGTVLGENYPNPDHRYSCDFDCFLGEDYEKANRMLEEKGVRVNRSFYKNSSFIIKGVLVENHRFCTPVRGNGKLKKLENALMEILKDGPIREMEDKHLFAPPPAFTALFVTQHSQSHLLHEKLVLKQLLDWVLFVEANAVALQEEGFDELCKKFGFAKFVEAMKGAGDFVLGSSQTMGESASRFLEDILQPCTTDIPNKGLAHRVGMVKNMLRGAWKYDLYSEESVLMAIFVQMKGFLFDRTPDLN